LLPSKMGRYAPSPGPPTTTSQPTTGSARKLLCSTFGLPLTACVLAASTEIATAGLAVGEAPRLSCVVGSAASTCLGARRSPVDPPPAGWGAAAGPSSGRPAAPAAGGAAFCASGAALPDAGSERLPRLISPVRSSRLAALSASRSEPRIRLGNDPGGCGVCPAAGRLSSFMGPLLL